MRLPILDAVEVTTGDEPELSVIWLHGLGADGYDFEPIVEELELPFAVRFVFPHAPVRPVTINGGVRMRAWYDIVAFGADAPEDATGIRASSEALRVVLDGELARGFDSRRIVLAGFSQGGAIALHAGLREPRRLAGVLVLSAYLPLAAALDAEKEPANLDVALMMAHGTADPIVPLALAEASKRKLEASGYTVEWRTYAMGHAVCAEQLRDIGRWLEARGA